MPAHVRSRVARLLHASVRRRAWTTASLAVAMLVAVVAMVGLLAWESTIEERPGGAVVDIEFGDDSSSGLRIVGGSVFAPPFGGQDDEPVDLGPGSTSGAAPDGILVRDSGGGAPAPGRTGGGGASGGDGSGGGGGTTTPAPTRPAPTAPRPGTTTPVADPATTTVAPLDPLPAADPLPEPEPAAPLPAIGAPPVVPTVEAGPVAGVSAGVDAGGIEASAPVVGDASVSLG